MWTKNHLVVIVKPEKNILDRPLANVFWRHSWHLFLTYVCWKVLNQIKQAMIIIASSNSTLDFVRLGLPAVHNLQQKASPV